MAQEPGVWGIDLGQCALKALRLQEINGQLTATAFDYVEHPKILSQPDADPDALTREALEKFLSRNSLRGDMVAISVPGQSGLARFVKLPPVEEKKIGDIVRFEAKQQIPFNLEEVVWDYQKIGSGIVTDGFAMETEIGLFAMKRDMIGKYLQHFKDVNVEVHVVQMAPLALCNFVAYDLLNKGALGEGGDEPTAGGKTKNCIVALDIGADSSNLVITDGERIIWQRPIPLGGNHFTRALTKDLKLTFAKAEHLKRNATKSPDLKKILASLKPVLNDFVGEVQRSLGYFTNTHRDAHVEYMVGLGNAFRLPGLQRFLGEKLQLDVRKLAKLERLGGDALNAPTYTENILGFAVAYGLAVQGLKHSRLVTNLLPSEIRVERMVRAKKPWAATAAACLLFASGVMATDAYIEYRAYGNPEVTAAMSKADAAAKAITDAENAFQKAKADAEAEERAVRAIVSGQAEQKNWLKITKFIGDIIPQPDGSNFPPENKKVYWEDVDSKRETKGGMPGERAFKEFLKRQVGRTASGEPGQGDELGRGIDDLIQFNIEFVDCRYADDMATAWSAIRNGMQDPSRGKVRPQSDWDKPPQGSGWVVEVKGHTYHHMRERFIIESLVENIARLGRANEAAASTPAPAGTPPAAASKPPAPTAGAKPGAAGPADYKALDDACKQPIKVSHVVLYSTEPRPVAGFTLEAVGSVSSLEGVVKASSGSGGAPTGPLVGGGTGIPGMPGPPAGAAGGAGSREGWHSLLGGVGGSGVVGEGQQNRVVQNAAAAVPRRGNISRRGGGEGGGESRNATAPTATPGLPPGTAPGTTEADAKHWRTNFSVLFVWQEPTPSDVLRAGATAGAKK